jgi:enoyl-CoA hydratase/carnithine racemase
MEYIKLEFDGRIARVVLDHPGGNRINFEMREELLSAFHRVEASDAHVLVITGTGPDFCLGGDVREWPGLSVDDLRPKLEVLAKALEQLEDLRIPTIAAVQGGCLGGGFELALSCDLIIAGRSAQFAFPEARLGILTLQGGVLQLAERIGRAKALELVLFSDPRDAEQMATWYIVNRVVADEDLGKETEAWARRLAAGAVNAHAGTKELLAVWRHSGQKGAKEALYDISMPLFDAPDVQAALRAVAEAMTRGMPIPDVTFAGRRSRPAN